MTSVPFGLFAGFQAEAPGLRIGEEGDRRRDKCEEYQTDAEKRRKGHP